MSRRIITLPLPNKALSPNARVHWAHKSRAMNAHDAQKGHDSE